MAMGAVFAKGASSSPAGLGATRDEADRATAVRRAALAWLLAQPGERVRRPCEGCVTACPCARSSSTCCCGCRPTCANVPRVLARAPERHPVAPAFVPILYGLAATRVLAPAWPAADSYAEFAPHGRVVVWIQTAQLEYAGLLAWHVTRLAAMGVLETPWRVHLVPSYEDAGAPMFALEPVASDVAARTLAADLRRIGETLAESLRGLARYRLRRLRGAGGGDDAATLTAREGEILDLLLAGLSVASIAPRLCISPHTVRNHVKHICAKLGVGSQRELRELFA